MRIAVLADIHGNAVALEAVVADICRRGTFDQVINLGDCVSGPLWPQETCRSLMRHNWSTVRGNHDRAVAFVSPAAMGPSDAYAHACLSADERDWLGNLPALVEIAPGAIACHGRPDDDNRYLLDDIVGGRLVASHPAKVAARLGAAAGAVRLVLCGHSHQPRILQLDGGPLVVNPGSVGCPAYDDASGTAHVSEAGTPHARYAIVETDPCGGFNVDLVALGYDHMAAARRAADNGRADWAQGLATGRLERGA
jgi:predicted phosphodiesterase